MRENDAMALMAKGIFTGPAPEYIEGWVTNSGPRTSPEAQLSDR